MFVFMYFISKFIVLQLNNLLINRSLEEFFEEKEVFVENDLRCI